MMSLEEHSDLEAGRQALEAGAWQEARHAFERLLQVEETPEALEGLGLAAWWLDLAEVVFDSRERAFRAYRSRGDHDRPPASPSGSPGTAPRSAAKKASPKAGCSAPVGCSTDSPIRRSMRFSPRAPRSSRCSTMAIRKPRRRWPSRRFASARRSARSTTRWSDARCYGFALDHHRTRHRGTARARRGQRRDSRRRADRSSADRARRLLSDRRLRSRPRSRPRRAVVRPHQGTQPQVGAEAAVRRVPHAVRVGLHVARGVGRSGARADERLRRARDLPSRHDHRRTGAARRAAAASGTSRRSGLAVRSQRRASDRLARPRRDRARSRRSSERRRARRTASAASAGEEPHRARGRAGSADPRATPRQSARRSRRVRARRWTSCAASRPARNTSPLLASASLAAGLDRRSRHGDARWPRAASSKTRWTCSRRAERRSKPHAPASHLASVLERLGRTRCRDGRNRPRTSRR